jgi:hypothetical protein
MNVPGNSVVLLTLLALFVACSGYAAGRLHQRFRTGRARDEAFREGYDTATRSVFSLAARVVGPRRGAAAVRASASVRAAVPLTVVPPLQEPVPPPVAGRPNAPTRFPAPRPVPSTGADGPAVSSSGRHTVPDELVRADTYRLAPDRVARAKVRHAKPEEPAPDDDTTRLPETPPHISVPRPRSS